MTMMIGKILRFGRRQLHTIISQEIIKPSSPTPSHLKTYNLSKLDLFSAHHYMPLILYYPNDKMCSLTPDDKVRKMKKSLSQSLSRYYPLAGRVHSPTSPYTLCNDEGVVFVESKHDSQMSMSKHDNDTIGQLFVDGLSWQHSPYNRADLLGVQVNHFACGGIAVAVAMSHLIGDGCTLGSLMSHWASVARYGSLDHKDVLPFNPNFVQVQATTDFQAPPPEAAVMNTRCVNPITRKFVFPNSKLSDLKKKVLAMAEGGSTLSINKPTRVEVLTSLIYKTWATGFKKSILLVPVNVRSKFVPRLPLTAMGNFGSGILVMTKYESEASLSVLVSKIQKGKMELEGVKSVQLACESIDSAASILSKEEGIENYKKFSCSSLCGYSLYKVDFGWGNPAVASVTLGPGSLTGAVLMDTPDCDGIEAWVTLETQDMERFQNDKELISFCQS